VATLEEAAQQLVEKLESLDGEIEDAQKSFAAHHEELAALDGQVGKDWDALTEEVTSFLEKVQEEMGKLNQDSQEAAKALAELKGEIEGVQSQAEAELEGSRADVNGLAEHLRALEPPIDTLVANGAETPFGNLRDLAQDVERQMEQALTEARDFLQDVVTELQDIQQDVEERSEELRSHIADECTQNLQTAYDEWQGHVEELEDLVKAKFEELPENAQEVVEYAMTECTTGHEEEFDRLFDVVTEIEQALERLTGTVDETGTDIGEEGRGAIDSRLSETSQALVRTVEALDRVKALLASYTFVQM